MIYIEAPDSDEYPALKSIFLAGGISDCHDWQIEVAQWFKDTDFLVINPRRKDFTICDSTEQIVWEHTRLRQADMILFWFPCETVCPITLFELGIWAGREKPIFVGCHPDYSRRFDVRLQMSLENIDVYVGLENLKQSVCYILDI